MYDIIRDSPIGHIVRLVTKNKAFQYPEEKDPELWKKWYNEEKSGFAAYHGQTEAPETDETDDNGEKVKDENGNVEKKTLDELRGDSEGNQRQTSSRSRASSQTNLDEQHSDRDLRSEEETDVETPTSREERTVNRSGVPVDPEKGKDVNIIDWDGPNDPEVRG